MNNKVEYILCAAVKRKKPREAGHPYKKGYNDILNVEIGYRHHDIYMRFGDEMMDTIDENGNNPMGFYTSKGRFVSRKEAMKIAIDAGQYPEEKGRWTQEEIDDPILPFTSKIEVGDYKPLFSEDLYCCSPDGNTMNETKI